MARFAALHRQALRDGFIDTCAPEARYGLSRSVLWRHLRSIGWVPWLPGLWVPGEGVPPHGVRCRAALAYIGGDALITGASALHELGIRGSAPETVELLLPGSRWIAPRLGLCLHYAIDFAEVRSVARNGLLLSGTRRSFAEHARHASTKELCTLLADAVRLRHCTLAQIGTDISARPGFTGCASLRQAHRELTGELNHSRYERLGRLLLREAGESVPSRPLPVVHRERTIAEIDIPFLDLSYGVEIDGPPHLLPDVAAKDRARDRMLARICGITIDRYLWFELEDQPGRFIREVTGHLRSLRTARIQRQLQ